MSSQDSEARGWRDAATSQGTSKPLETRGAKNGLLILGLWFYCLRPPVCAGLLYQLANLFNTPPPAGPLFLMAEALWLSLSWEEISFCWGRRMLAAWGVRDVRGCLLLLKSLEFLKIILIYLWKENLRTGDGKGGEKWTLWACLPASLALSMNPPFQSMNPQFQ